MISLKVNSSLPFLSWEFPEKLRYQKTDRLFDLPEWYRKQLMVNDTPSSEIRAADIAHFLLDPVRFDWTFNSIIFVYSLSEAYCDTLFIRIQTPSSYARCGSPDKNEPNLYFTADLLIVADHTEKSPDSIYSGSLSLKKCVLSFRWDPFRELSH